MSIAGIVLSRPDGVDTRRSRRPHTPDDVRSARAATEASLDEVVVVLADESRAAEVPSGATLLLDADGIGGARALRSAIDWCQREGHYAVVVALEMSGAAFEADAWAVLARTTKGPIAVLAGGSALPALARLAAESWPTIPLDGTVAQVTSVRPELVVEVERSAATTTTTPSPGTPASDDEIATVTRLLGRPPQCAFEIVVRTAEGEPVVIENAPFLEDGTPMPTRYWLIGKREQEAVGRLESAGGVRRATDSVAASAIAETHARYAAGRDARIPADHQGPRPYGGVGGTREGIKCLHAHLAWYLAGGGDPVGRWTAQQLVGEIDGPVGAIDCGTNSTRLLILGRGGETLAREMTITRLGQGVDATGKLAPEAIARTLTVLRRYREVLDMHGVVAVRATATSAARDATNAPEFFDGAEMILGVRPELSGAEEGDLSYAGATADFDPADGPYLVCDLGGGSTELVAGGSGTDRAPAVAVSLDLGCVRVTERFLTSDPPTKEDLEGARRFVESELSAAITAHPALTVPKVMIGLAGTVASLTSLALGLDTYDHDKLHHARLSRLEVERFLGELAEVPLADRRHRPGLEPGRAEVIVGGTLVLASVMARFGFEELVHSESDILDGTAAELRRIRSVPGTTTGLFSGPPRFDVSASD